MDKFHVLKTDRGCAKLQMLCKILDGKVVGIR